MSTSVTSGTYPRARSARTPALPRGLQQVGTRVWAVLCDLANHRAYPELMRLSRLQAQSNPVLSQQLREAAQNLMKS